MSERMMTEAEIRHMRLFWHRRAFSQPSALSRGAKNTALSLNPHTLARMERLNVVVRIVERVSTAHPCGANFRRSWYLTEQGRTEAAMLFAREDA